MLLYDALATIGQRLNIDAHHLWEYAQEDAIGGRDTGNWQPMSLHADEGRVLYALVRALRPRACLEIGVADGCSATHILTALHRNQHGELYSYDIDPACGGGVPVHLRGRWHLNIVDDALTVPSFPAAQFVFEDGPHTYDWTAAMYRRIDREIRPRVLVTHDYYTHETYPEFGTFRAFQDVFEADSGVKLDNAFTGLGYWCY